MAAASSARSAGRRSTARAPARNAAAASAPSVTSAITAASSASSLTKSRAVSESNATTTTSTRTASSSRTSANSSSAMPTISTPGACSIRLAMPSSAVASTAQIATAITAGRRQMPWQPPWAGSRGGGPLDDGNRRAGRGTGADEPQLDGGPDALGPKPLEHVAHLRDRRSIPRGQQVAEHKSRAFGRSLGIDAHHDDPGSPRRRERLSQLCVEPDTPHAEADIAARDAAFGEKLIGDAIDRRRRDRENAPPRAWYHDTHRFSGGVDQGSALSRRVEPEIEADEMIDDAAAHAAPGSGRGRYNAEAGDDRGALVCAAANGKHEVAGTKCRRITRPRHGHALRAFDPQARPACG